MFHVDNVEEICIIEFLKASESSQQNQSKYIDKLQIMKGNKNYIIEVTGYMYTLNKHEQLQFKKKILSLVNARRRQLGMQEVQPISSINHNWNYTIEKFTYSQSRNSKVSSQKSQSQNSGFFSRLMGFIHIFANRHQLHPKEERSNKEKFNNQSKQQQDLYLLGRSQQQSQVKKKNDLRLLFIFYPLINYKLILKINFKIIINFQYYKQSVKSYKKRYMNRICLKRKQAQKKSAVTGIVDQNTNENIQIQRQQKQEKQQECTTSPALSKVAMQDANTNQRMFQQFRIQYDQLRIAYQTQRTSYDQVLQQKKRLEIQILNNNPEFYEKQIKRLRGEVQKLQEQNQDYKHKFIIAENSKKQLQATVKVRNDQLKKSIQTIQKDKITCVELKHQLTEKQKIFQRITSEMQKSNTILSQSFQQSNIKIQKLQFNLKSKTHDLEALQRNYDHMAKKLTETEKVMKASKQIYEQTNTKKTQMIDQLQTKLRNLNRSSRQTIQGLQTKISQIKDQRKTQNLLIDQQIQNKKSFKLQCISELEIVRLQQNNKQLKLDFDAKCKFIKTLQQKLLSCYTLQEYQQLEKKYRELQTRLQQVTKQYQEKLNKAQKQTQNIKLSQFRNPGEEKGITSDFQHLLKAQVQQNAKIKRQLSFKIDQVYNIKADLQDMKCKLRANQDQITILNKKIKSQQKNHKIQTDVSSQNLKNQIDSLKRKLDMAQGKIDQKTKEIKERQNFIMSTIVGRSKQEDVPLIIAQMQRIFEADYMTRLSAAVQKIQQLEKRSPGLAV